MEEKLLELFNEVLYNNGLPKIEELKADIHLRNDLDFDSINLAELTVRIEDKFEVDIFEDGLVETVGEILDKLKNDK